MTVTFSQKAEPVAPPLIGPDEPAPFTVFNPDGKARCLLVCDHASNYIPAKLNKLGLNEEDLLGHIAWDVGVADVTRQLAEILDAPAILGNYSRLVIDLNRRIDHPTSIVTSGDGRPVPGNAGMADEERLMRIRELYEPYHAQLDSMVKDFLARGIVPAVISIHSFTRVFFKQVRPWEIGLLWTQDPRLPVPTMEYFRKKGYNVGDNEPYDGRILRGTTINRHADAHRLPNALLEIRNDLLQTDEQRQEWGDMLGECYTEVLKDESIYRRYDGPEAAYDPDKEHSYFEELINKAKREGEK